MSNLFDHVWSDAMPDTREKPNGQRIADRGYRSLANAERAIVRTIWESRGVIGGPLGAAALLGMKRTTLQANMRKLGISRLAPFDGERAIL
jgi:formate hydrogenlyase transcriptional activator